MLLVTFLAVMTSQASHPDVLWPSSRARSPAATDRGDLEGRPDRTGLRPSLGVNGFGNLAGKK
jgi:hypothetical protein